MQSPDGSRYAAAGSVYEASGRPVAALPWGTQSFTWSSDGTMACKAMPLKNITGSAMELVTLDLATGTPRVVASGFATYSDNAGYPVLACDAKADRVIVGVFGQGLFAGRVFVFKLSTGQQIRSADAPQGAVASWISASRDGTLLASSTRMTGTGAATTVLQRADDGTVLKTLDDLDAWGLSADGSLVLGVRGAFAPRRIVEWRSDRTIWSADGYPYGAYFASPRGTAVAIAVGFDYMGADWDTYLFGSDGSVQLLPHGARFGAQ